MSLSRGKNALPSRYLQFEGYSQRCKKLERTFISAFNLQHEITSIQDCVYLQPPLPLFNLIYYWNIVHSQLVRTVCLEHTPPPPNPIPHFCPLSSVSRELILVIVYRGLAEGRNLWFYEIENNWIWECIQFCKIDDLLQFIFSLSHICLSFVPFLIPIATIFFYRANTSRTSKTTSLASSLPNVQM